MSQLNSWNCLNLIVLITPVANIYNSGKNKFNVGVGALVGGVLGDGDSEAFCIVYGTSTLGTREKNFSLSLGYGFTGNNWADAPTVTLSGMVRTGKNGYFLTENYFISSGGTIVAIISMGGRYVFKKLAIDFGGVIPIVDGDTGIGPWLGINVPFGNKIVNKKAHIFVSFLFI